MLPAYRKPKYALFSMVILHVRMRAKNPEISNEIRLFRVS